ncbi:protein CA_C1420 [Patella vulgata]|uniref:protein CA_C1420 n=1 Tax=Patella vulgata TaxID=6465 RepID=UPI0024A9A644|nr:protein CA_C1420 [Patella vulgata]
MKSAEVAVLVTLTITIDFVMGEIKGAFVMPHGGIALDPSKFHTTNKTALEEAWKIHTACAQIGSSVNELQPDLILLSTPHGISDINNFLFYLNPKMEGYANTDNTGPPPYVSLSVNSDVHISGDLVQHFGSMRNVSGLSAYGPPEESTEPFPLRWGEVIPLHFMPNLNQTKVVILSQPSRRYNDDMPTMIPELLKLGYDIGKYFESKKKTAVVIISADLAHTHSKDGPYGYSDAAQPFDDACGKWVENLDEQSLTKEAASYVIKAKSCGYTGLVMLQGLLSASSGGIMSWQSQLYANYHPSYYGMMVASFLRK